MLIANFSFLCSGVSGLAENIPQTILKKLDSPIQNEEIGGMPSLSLNFNVNVLLHLSLKEVLLILLVGFSFYFP